MNVYKLLTILEDSEKTPVKMALLTFTRFSKIGLLSLISICLLMSSCSPFILGRSGGRSGATKGKLQKQKEIIHITFQAEKKVTAI